MIKEKVGPRERILETTSRLFYEQGYQSTGINQIIQESETHKASFYRHFESKDDLAEAYLKNRGDLFAGVLEIISKRSQNAKQFFRLWQSTIRRMAKDGELHGCPLVSFNVQLGKDREKFKPQIADVAQRWLGITENFLKEEQRSGRLPGGVDIGTAAKRVMIIYQGHIQMFKLTEDLAMLSSMAEEMLAAVR